MARDHLQPLSSLLPSIQQPHATQAASPLRCRLASCRRALGYWLRLGCRLRASNLHTALKAYLADSTYTWQRRTGAAESTIKHLSGAIGR